MGKCPVCNKNTRQLQCPDCGFDGSCNYERYPSLGNLPRATESVNARQAALAEKEKNMLRCPSCGGVQFTVDVETNQYCCSECGHRFPLTARTEQRAEADRPTPPQSSRSKMEIFVLRLGWGYVPFQTLYLLFGSKGILFEGDPVFDIIRYWLIPCTILMQLRLWKKGWSEPLRNKFLSGFEILVSTYGRFLAYLAVLMFIIFAGYGIGHILDIPWTDALALFWFGIAGVYHALWHTGLKLGLGLPGLFDSHKNRK